MTCCNTTELYIPADKIECVSNTCGREKKTCIRNKESSSAFRKAIDTPCKISVAGYEDTKRSIDNNKSVADIKEEARDITAF